MNKAQGEESDVTDVDLQRTIDKRSNEGRIQGNSVSSMMRRTVEENYDTAFTGAYRLTSKL